MYKILNIIPHGVHPVATLYVVFMKSPYSTKTNKCREKLIRALGEISDNREDQLKVIIDLLVFYLYSIAKNRPDGINPLEQAAGIMGLMPKMVMERLISFYEDHGMIKKK
jgi:hypothetical protein